MPKYKLRLGKPDKEFAPRWISRALHLSGINQTELAKRLGISNSLVSRIATGKVEVSTGILAMILGHCGFEIIELKVKRSAPVIRPN